MNPSKIESDAQNASLKLKLEASIRSKILVNEAISALERVKNDNPDDVSIDASIKRLTSVIEGDDSAIENIQEKLLRVLEREARAGLAERVTRLTADVQNRVERDAERAAKRAKGA